MLRHERNVVGRAGDRCRVHAGVRIDRHFTLGGAWHLLRRALLSSGSLCVLVMAAGCSTSPAGPATDASAPPAPVTAVADTTPHQHPFDTVPKAGPGAQLGDWKLENRFLVTAALGDQGLATVSRPGEKTEIVFRGALSIRPGLREQGWVHIGDPDSWHGYLFDAYQASPSKGEKLFEVTTPKGEVRDFIHRLDPGEAYNNSFVAITPDGQWMVSGEWGDMQRLLVFPTPLVNPAASAGSLAMAAVIPLDHPVRNVQGCVFSNPTQLLCSTQDPGTDLWPSPDQLLELTLIHPLDGTATTADVRYLGALPLLSECVGTYEPEGVDYHSGTLRVEVRAPGTCGLAVTVYQYRRSQ